MHYLHFFIFCLFIFSRAESIELKQTVFPLMFDDGVNYQIFSNGDKKTHCIFEWEISNFENNSTMACSIQSDNHKQIFSSSIGESVIFLMFNSDEYLHEIVLYNKENFSQAAMWRTVNATTPYIQFPIWIALPAHQIVPPGEYKCLLTLQLFSQNQQLLREQVVELKIDVPPSQLIDIVLNGETGTQSCLLDFGETCQVTTKPFQVRVSSNIPYEISAKSRNHWKLKMSSEWQRANYKDLEINYSMDFNGQKMSFNENDIQLLLKNYSSEMVDQKPYSAAITVYPDITTHWEGTYEDEITFSISVNH